MIKHCHIQKSSYLYKPKLLRKVAGFSKKSLEKRAPYIIWQYKPLITRCLKDCTLLERTRIFFPHAPYQIFAAVWYGEYQGVVQAVPHRGIESTTPWYREYHAVVFQPIANIKNNTE